MTALFKVAPPVILLVLLYLRVPAFSETVDAPFRFARGVGVSVELQNLRSVILLRKTATGQYPLESEFHELVRENFHSKIKNPSMDFWGRPYVYARIEKGFVVGSLGPDGRIRTDDDIYITHEEP